MKYIEKKFQNPNGKCQLIDVEVRPQHQKENNNKTLRKQIENTRICEGDLLGAIISRSADQ